MMRKIALLMTLAMTMGTLMGCGDKASEEPKEEEKSESITTEITEVTETTGEREEVTFWHYITDLEKETLEGLVEEYNASQEKVTVKLEYVPREELLKQYTIGAVSGELPDIGIVDNPDHASFSSMGIFADITEQFNAWEENQFLEGPLNSCKYDGGLYGVPFNSNCLALFYDEDVLKEAGMEVPTTWEELEIAAQKLTTDKQYGLVMSALKTEEATFQFIPFLLSTGGNVEQLTSAESVKALAFEASLVEKGYMSKEVINWGQIDAEKQFAAGSAAMMINGPWCNNLIEADAPEKNWNVAVIPKDKEYASVLGGENIAISQNANIDACWDFVSWFTSKEISTRFCSEVKKFSPRADVSGEDTFPGDAVMGVFGEQLQYAQPRGPHPKWTEVSSAIQIAVQQALTGEKSPEDAMAAAQATVDEINASMQ